MSGFMALQKEGSELMSVAHVTTTKGHVEAATCDGVDVQGLCKAGVLSCAVWGQLGPHQLQYEAASPYVTGEAQYNWPWFGGLRVSWAPRV